MNNLYLKILALFLLFVGEGLSVYAEMIGAKYFSSSSFLQLFPKMFGIITVAGAFLIAGYMLGFYAFKNIWIIAVASVTFILIVEPIIGWILFQHMPSNGTIAGFLLGIIGFFLAIFF